MPALVGLATAGCALNRAGREEVAAALARHMLTTPHVAVAYASAPVVQAQAVPEAEQPVAELSTPETLRGFIVQALRENPDIKAAEETAKATAERIAQVTALPDPMVMGKAMPEPARMAEGDNLFIVGLSQTLPVPAKLDLSGRMALEETRMAVEELQETRLRVIAEVKRAYFQLYVLDKSIAVTRANQDLLRGLIDVARAQVTGGRRPQDDVLSAQVESSGLEAEIIALERDRIVAVARLNELLNREPTTPVPSPQDFNIRRADVSLDQLLARAAEANPALRRLQHQIEREEHAVELAKLAYWPDFTLGFEWMYVEPGEALTPPQDPSTGPRPAVSTMSEEGTDGWAIIFGFTLPIWFGKTASGITEAGHRLLAARQEYVSMGNRIHFQIEDALEGVRAQRKLAALFESTIIPQAQQAYQVSQASYVAGVNDFLYVIENWRKWLAFTIEYHRSLGELERSVADLEEAIGLSLPELGEPQ